MQHESTSPPSALGRLLPDSTSNDHCYPSQQFDRQLFGHSAGCLADRFYRINHQEQSSALVQAKMQYSHGLPSAYPSDYSNDQHQVMDYRTDAAQRFPYIPAGQDHNPQNLQAQDTSYLLPSGNAYGNGMPQSGGFEQLAYQPHTYPEQHNPVPQMSLTLTKDEPYATLIYRALSEAPGNAMVLKDIYEWFERNTDKAKTGSIKGWQNSIRHNLSMNQVSKDCSTELVAKADT
jgi:hypothetical protein